MNTIAHIEEKIPRLESTIDELYVSTFPIVARMVKKLHGSFEDARDIFHDGLVLLEEKERNAELAFSVSKQAYLVGICKHLWLKKHRQEEGKISLDAVEASLHVPTDFYPTVDTVRLLNVVENTSKRCLDLLRLFYFKLKSIGEITNLLGYGSEHTASVQKYKCLERVRNEIKQKAMTYEDFLE